ncbi:ABC-type phosphate transport system permease component [Methanonatronarchaeum thermophilum]|uniref:Phosphate transport system permease protein n=1 Tax=Methanonatronarchaeum thermophilum TaxID=1927129 RepID=A0A1Y3GA23_9EURY|nr:phosphate ABC transporter permease subunit PstC [Methanonatronarchaeum thermophilum]OUJ18291.1 ABC-type phosphate transport system permease component [Methanonatronarchaeum thermophilum]
MIKKLGIKRIRLKKIKENLVRFFFLSIAVLSASMIIFIFGFLANESIPALTEVGLDLLSFRWSASNNQFGLLPAIIGTLLVTLIAMTISIPLGLSSALYLSEICTKKTRNILKPVIEILAGIPSIVYGFIGVVIFVPNIGEAFDLISGYTIFTAGFMLSIMALPIVISLADDALNSVPQDFKNASMALGATEWQTMKKVTLPAAISGVANAIILGTGRVIGETMCVMLVVGGIMKKPEPIIDIFTSGSTLTSLIGHNMGEAYGLHVNVLFTAGVILLSLVIILSLSSDWIRVYMKKKRGGH